MMRSVAITDFGAEVIKVEKPDSEERSANKGYLARAPDTLEDIEKQKQKHL